MNYAHHSIEIVTLQFTVQNVYHNLPQHIVHQRYRIGSNRHVLWMDQANVLQNELQ